jgi:hypothetical protein
MKKVIFLSLFITLIIPNIVLAAWWNPLSWFNGWDFLFKKDNDSAILEKRILDLESQLGVSTSSEEVNLSDDTNNESKEVKSNTVNTKVIAPAKNNDVVESEIKSQVDIEVISQQNKERIEQLNEAKEYEVKINRINNDIQDLKKKYSADLNDIREQRLALEKEYLSKQVSIQNAPGQSKVLVNAQLSNLNQQYSPKFSELDIKEESLTIEYNKKYQILADKYDDAVRN